MPGIKPVRAAPMDLKKHLESAADAVKRRNYPFAIKLYSQLLAIQPDSGEARAGLREALFRKVEQRAASRPLAMMFGGIHLLTGGLMRLLHRYDAAAKSYERYLAKDPLLEGANLRLGESLERAGWRRSALAVYRAYAEQQPRCLPACRAAGALLYEAGAMAEALELYEQALKVDPRDQESLRARKNLAAEGALKKTGIVEAGGSRELIKDKEAQRKIERAQRIQLSKEEIAQELGPLEESLAGRPDDLKLLQQVAAFREMDGDLRGALDCLERARDLRPDDGEVQDRAGDLGLRVQEQRVAEARARGDDGGAQRAETALREAEAAEYRRRVDRNPTDLGLRFRLGRALAGLSRNDEAIAELQQAVKDPRNRTDSLVLLGDGFLSKELPELALEQYEKALDALSQTTPRRKDVLYAMGLVCEGMGRREQALRHYTRILEQDIGYRDVATKVEQIKAS